MTGAVLWSGPTNDALRIPGAESQEANDLLVERLPEFAGSSAQVVFAAPLARRPRPATSEAVERVLTEAAVLPGRGVGDRPRCVRAPCPTTDASALHRCSTPFPAPEVPKDSAEALLALATTRRATACGCRSVARCPR